MIWTVVGEDIKLRRGLYMIFWGMSDASLVACLIASLYDPDFFLLLNRDWNIEKQLKLCGFTNLCMRTYLWNRDTWSLLVYSYYQQAFCTTTGLNSILDKAIGYSGRTTSKNLEQVLMKQRQPYNVFEDLDPLEHCIATFTELKILTVVDLYIQEAIIIQSISSLLRRQNDMRKMLNFALRLNHLSIFTRTPYSEQTCSICCLKSLKTPHQDLKRQLTNLAAVLLGRRIYQERIMKDSSKLYWLPTSLLLF